MDQTLSIILTILLFVGLWYLVREYQQLPTIEFLSVSWVLYFIFSFAFIYRLWTVGSTTNEWLLFMMVQVIVFIMNRYQRIMGATALLAASNGLARARRAKRVIRNRPRMVIVAKKN